MSDYIPRLVDSTLDLLGGELPAVMLTGPRGCGKTTTAVRRAKSILRLDDDEQARAVRAAPDEVLAALEPPVLIDEWQNVPEVLAAVKRSVDRDPSPGHFLLTGSVRSRLLASGWPATGRITPLAMFGMSVEESQRSADARTALDRLFGPADPAVGRMDAAPGLTDYLELGVRGGFPAALGRGDHARSLWYDGYIDNLVHHDVADLAEVRSPAALSLLLRAVALNTAGIPTSTTLERAAGLTHRTALSYLDLLEDLRIIDRVPAWGANRLARMVKAPKYYVTDPGMAAHLMGDDRSGLLLSPDRSGRLIDTFVMAQLRPLLRLRVPTVSAGHLRNTNGDREVDIVLEAANGQVVGLEIKSATSVDGSSARHLAWLRDQIGDQFVRGLVLHAGSLTYPLGERIWAVPIATLWRG